MTSRFQAVMNDLELAAKKLGISIEDAVLILLGKHSTHCVTAKPFPQVNVSNSSNPSTTSTPVAASVAAQNQQAAVSTVSGSSGSGEEGESNID